MNSARFNQMRKEAQETADFFNTEERQQKFYGSRRIYWAIEQLYPLGDEIGMVIFLKTDGQRALMLMLWNNQKKYFEKFFPTDEQLMAMSMMPYFKMRLEAQNAKQRTGEREG